MKDVAYPLFHVCHHTIIISGTQEEYLSRMCQRLGWYISVLEEIDREEHPPLHAIPLQSPQPLPKDTFEQISLFKSAHRITSLLKEPLGAAPRKCLFICLVSQAQLLNEPRVVVPAGL
jgi:hypothetical protein